MRKINNGGNALQFDGAFALYERDIRMYKNPVPQTNYKTIIKEWIKGFAAIAFILFVILGWTIALTPIQCTHDYKTGITSC